MEAIAYIYKHYPQDLVTFHLLPDVINKHTRTSDHCFWSFLFPPSGWSSHYLPLASTSPQWAWKPLIEMLLWPWGKSQYVWGLYCDMRSRRWEFSPDLENYTFSSLIHDNYCWENTEEDRTYGGDSYEGIICGSYLGQCDCRLLILLQDWLFCLPLYCPIDDIKNLNYNLEASTHAYIR